MLGFNPLSGLPISGNAVAGGGAKVDYTLSAAAGSYALTAQAATALVGRKLTGSAGSYAITAQAGTFTVARKLSGSVGAYAITAPAATLAYGRTLTGAAGSYAYTGQAATGLVARNLAGASGTYLYSGLPATLAYVDNGPVAPVVPPSTGAGGRTFRIMAMPTDRQHIKVKIKRKRKPFEQYVYISIPPSLPDNSWATAQLKDLEILLDKELYTLAQVKRILTQYEDDQEIIFILSMIE